MGNLLTRFRHRDVRVILLGLDSAGKTSILYRLKLDDLVTTVPTIGFNVENIQYKDLHLTAWDIGSRDKIRPLFRHYYKGADAVVFVIDSHDPERLDELNYDVIKPAVSAEELTNAVFLFLANKTDLPDTITTEEISEKLGLKYLKHPWGILPVSAANGDGLQAALEWLAVRLGSAQVKARNFTTVQPKPKLLNQCRTGSSLSSSSSTATSKTDNSKVTSKVAIPQKPVILVNSKLYSDIMTTPTMSSGSVDNASVISVSTPGSCYSSYAAKRNPGSVMNTFSSYSITQSMRDDLSRRQFSTISRSDIRKMSCASLSESVGNRKQSICSLLDSPSQRKMSTVSLMDSPYRRKMSSSFVIDAPPYRKFSSASLIDAAYTRKMSASSLGGRRDSDTQYGRKQSATSLGDRRGSDAQYGRKQSATSLGDRRDSDTQYSRKLSATSLGEYQMLPAKDARKLIAVSLRDSQDEPEKPRMSFLTASPVDMATPPTSKRKSVDLSLAGFGKFSPIMADYVNNDRKDSDTSCDSLNLVSPAYHAQNQLQTKSSLAVDSFRSASRTIEDMKEDHYNEILYLLPDSYTNMYFRDYFSQPMGTPPSEEERGGSINAPGDIAEKISPVVSQQKSNHVFNKNPRKKNFLKSIRQLSHESDSSVSPRRNKGMISQFYLLCTPAKRSQRHYPKRSCSKEEGTTGAPSPSRRPYCARAYSAIRCLFVKENKSVAHKDTSSFSSDDDNKNKDTSSFSSDHDNKNKDKRETKVSFDFENHNIKVEIVDVDEQKVDTTQEIESK